jgi:uncharacterized protein
MLLEKIENDLKSALKSKDALRVSTIRFLKCSLQNLAIEKRKDLQAMEDKDILSVINRQVKQRLDSIEGFRKGSRQDLVEKEQSELDILKTYLPPEISDERLRDITREAIAATGAASPKDTGNVIKLVMSKVQGQANGSRVSGLVKEELAKSCE